MTRPVGQAMTQAALDAAEAARNSAVTIAARLPIFAGLCVVPTASALTEWNEACSEKLQATWEGGIAAVSAWNAMLIGAVFTPLTPLAFASGAIHVMGEASAPAHRAVRANALRLSRRGR